MFSIKQTATGWQVLNAAGDVIGGEHATYDLALMAISAQLAALMEMAPADPAAAEGDGLLPETWVSTTGVAFQERLAGGRDFSECVWTWRDPGVYPLPLMHQTETDMGHFGATVAGYADTWELRDGTVYPSGRFYATPEGVALRDMMLGGRRVGVSVDPTEDVNAEFRCTDFDDEGWCNDGDMVFLTYEIGGLTATPFPGFPTATIELGDPAAATTAAPAMPIAAGARAAFVPAPMYPPRPWFEMPEPQLGSDLLVEQDDGGLAVPLTITDELQVFGHVARDGQCHASFLSECVTPPEGCALASWRGPEVVCEDGTRIAAGPLIAGMDHPVLTMRCPEAQDAYAHNGSMWAQVTMHNGQFGTWFCGSLLPDVTELQVRVLRGSVISGDWRQPDGEPMDLIAALAVPIGGFGITRQAIAASGLLADGAIAASAPPMPRVLYRGPEGPNRRIAAMVSVGMVARCPECQRRALAAAAGRPAEEVMRTVLAEIRHDLAVIERRTRPMVADAITAAASRVQR